MAELITLARPYAVAVFKQAKQTGTADIWSEQLAFLSAVMADQRMQRAAANPKAKREDFTKAFMQLCEGHMNPEGQNFVRLLIQNHRLDLVGEIATLYAQYRAEDEGYVDVKVASAFDLTADELKQLSKTLDTVLGKKSKIEVAVDESLIGGVFIRAGDRVIDASLRGQLERLAKNLRN